jgi:hypothetical protein
MIRPVTSEIRGWKRSPLSAERHAPMCRRQRNAIGKPESKILESKIPEAKIIVSAANCPGTNGEED